MKRREQKLTINLAVWEIIPIKKQTQSLTGLSTTVVKKWLCFTYSFWY